MPAVTFSDMARLRLEVISLFLVVLLASAGFIWALWNWLRSDFPRLPGLSYAKACGIVTLWGLLFVVVLTMISGAREVMTPGAWERDGATYNLRNGEATPSEAIEPIDSVVLVVDGEVRVLPYQEVEPLLPREAPSCPGP